MVLCRPRTQRVGLQLDASFLRSIVPCPVLGDYLSCIHGAKLRSVRPGDGIPRVSRHETLAQHRPASAPRRSCGAAGVVRGHATLDREFAGVRPRAPTRQYTIPANGSTCLPPVNTRRNFPFRRIPMPASLRPGLAILGLIIPSDPSWRPPVSTGARRTLVYILRSDAGPRSSCA